MPDKQAFPLGGSTDYYQLGMTYREWLIGMIASRLPKESYYAFDASAIISRANAIIEALEEEAKDAL